MAFGSVQVGGSQKQSATLTNSGGSSIVISQATMSGTGFSLSGISLPLTLAAGDKFHAERDLRSAICRKREWHRHHHIKRLEPERHSSGNGNGCSGGSAHGERLQLELRKRRAG